MQLIMCKNNLKDFFICLVLLVCLFVLQEVKMKFFKQESGGGKEDVKFRISIREMFAHRVE